MKNSILITVLLLMVSCTGQRLNFDKGIIPPVPVNFAAVNSAYDDYNSDIDITWAEKSFTLIFSTHRMLPDAGFDFISFGGNIQYDLIEGDFSMHVMQKDISLLDAVNSNSNEFGPFFTADYPDYFPWKSSGEEGRFFYCSDPEGNLDIYCCNYELGEGVFAPLGDPFALTALNTGHDEGYLTIHPEGSSNRETIYFMSDRDGSFDIWSATGEEGKLINESSAVTVTRVPALSSSADDKCPYICGNMMVFTSDRDGGFGGFDLWYSVYSGQGWSVPVNLGGDINTEFDEYRPVVVSAEQGYFLNDLLIFSSNRPGGKGGFDLYYAGVPRR